MSAHDVAERSAAPDRTSAAPELPQAEGSPTAPLLALQRQAGNAATAALLRHGGSRPLRGATSGPRPLPDVAIPQGTGHPGNRAAWSRTFQALAALGAGSISPMVAARAARGDLDTPLREQADRLLGAWSSLGSGRSVPDGARAPFERSFGHDLGAARMHVGTPAARDVTSALGVEALAVGNHMVFASPPSAPVLGHELAHVVQQSVGSQARSGGLRAAAPRSGVEQDADRAASAALAGRPHAVGPSGGEDLAMLAPIAWLAIAALIAGVGIGVTAEVAGPSYEENRERSARRRADDSIGAWAHATWLWVPVGGTATRIWEAESAGERVFNILMMPLDVLTLGAVGSSMAKIANRGVWQTALRQASREELAELSARGVSAMSHAQVQAQTRIALESGQAIIATVGRRNHAVVFVKVGDRYFRLGGGAFRSMAVTEMAAFNPRSVNAFYAFGGAAESAAMLREAQQLSRLWSGVGFSFRSCGISASRLAEAGGLNLGMSGAQAYLPVTVMGTLAEQGVVGMSQTGARRMLAGTAMQYGLMGSVRGSATLASNPDRHAASLVYQLTGYDPAPATSSIDAAGAGPYGEAVEVTEAEVHAALDGGLDGGAGHAMNLLDAPAAYMDLRSRVDPVPLHELGAAEQVTITPMYTFVAAQSESLAQLPPADLDQCIDLSGASALGEPSDPRHVLELSRATHYRAGASRLAGDLASASNRWAVLDRARDYFPFTFVTTDDCLAAIAAMEREGIVGPDLDRASASFGGTPAPLGPVGWRP